MKAAFLTGIRRIEVRDAPPPRIERDDDVLVRVRSVGVCGSDIHYYSEGRIGDQVVSWPFIAGHEVAGEAAAVGPAVTSIRPGDPLAVEPGIVCGGCEQCLSGRQNLCAAVRFLGTPPVAGAFREYLVMPAANCMPIPRPLSFDDGALSEPLAIGIHGVRLSGFRVGDTAAVIGAGPIGLSALFALRAGGAARILVSDPIPARLEAARALGADETVNAAERDAADAVLAATAGRGVDVSFEAVGTSGTFGQAVRMARIGGTAVLFGIPAGDTVSLDPHVMRRRELRLLNVRRSVRTAETALALLARDSGAFSRLVTHRFPAERIAEAMELVAAYRDGVIKAVITF